MTGYNRTLTYQFTLDRSVSPMRSAVRMSCSKCGAHESITVKSTNDNPEKIAKLFIARGWKASPWRASVCVCPACVSAQRTNDPDSRIRNLRVVPMTEKTKVAEILADARDATPAEKAAIRRKLDETFDDDAGMYLDGASDQSIGTALNIPWSLVRRVREAAYGPIRSDPQLEKARTELRALSDEVAAIKVKVDKAMSDLGAAFKRLGM